MEHRAQVDSVYVDFAKAFNKVNSRVNWTILISPIGYLLQWIENFMGHRTQMIRNNGCLSKLIIETSGVPHNTHLGPLLFLLFSNDLEVIINSKFLVF